MTPERTCRTCVHCKVRSVDARHGRRVDGCARHHVACSLATISRLGCFRSYDWTPALWHRRVVARLITALERLGVLR